MGDFEKVAEVGEINPGEGKVVEADGFSVAVFNIAGNYYAMDNTCPHQGGPLGEGTIEGDTVTCPWHGWMFSVKDGTCSFNPNVCVPTFKVKVNGSDILVAKP